MRETWVLLDGKIEECNWDENHYDVAMKLFPHSKNPEHACEKAGYIKTGHYFNGSPFQLSLDKDRVTQAQMNSLDKLWKEHYERR